MSNTTDRVWLDSQYNLRVVVSERDQCVAQWRELSEVARQNVECQLDLAFGPSNAERLDFFPAKTPVVPPLFIFLHGGYWRANDKSDFSYIAPPFSPRGISVASVNYSLAPKATLDVMVDQTCRAVAWLWKNAQKLGFDRTRMFLSGHSAGAHLTAMAMLANWSALGIEENPLRGAAPISGLYELEPLRHCFLNEVLNLDEPAAIRNSPIRHLDRVDANSWRQREVIFCVGGRETDEFKRQQADFVAAWSGRGLPSQVIEDPDHHHYDVILELGKPGSALFEGILAMIHRSSPNGGGLKSQ